jgi:hypothetical protein
VNVLLWIAGRLGTALWPVVGAAALGMLATVGWLSYRVSDLKEDLQGQGAKFNEERLLASRATAREEAKNRAEEKRVRDAQQEKIDAAEQTIARERADRAIADAAAGRLSQRLDAYLASARKAARDPTPAQASPPADDPTGVLAELLGRCSARVRLLASVADERGTAGQLCEQSYDTLTETRGTEP